ncbi:MAG TPA: hypothetical protein VHG29_08040 [Novosphingobium sp.]|nr:hypothetical protein [Novosphingobium sp.]
MIEFIPLIIGGATAVGLVGTLGWIHTTRFKIKHGYPLTGAWGQSVYPKTTSEDREQIALLAQENTLLRDELGALKSRLATVEQIVTDPSLALTSQIAALADNRKETR